MPRNLNEEPGDNELELIEIQSWDEVPAFENEDEEDTFWATHSLGKELLKQFRRRMRTNRTQLLSGHTASGHDFFSRPAQSLEELAAQQGVKPVKDFDALLGDFWPEDETADQFIAAVRHWRREGSDA